MIENMQEYVRHIRAAVSDRLDLTREVEDDEIREVISQIVAEESRQNYLSLGERQTVIETVFNSMRGLDVLQPLVDDPSITEIMINGPHHVFIEQNGRLYQKNVSFGSKDNLLNVILNIVSKVNRTVNEANPIVDARLLDGSRVNVVLPPIALDGPTVTIRKFPEDPMTVKKLIEYGSITPEVAELLERMVKAKFNIFISGGTGSGKTTFLNALSNFIPRDERVITIEDSAELQLKGIDNLVRMETRNANMEGKGEVTIRDLIRSSLRMRPERIVVGEVRGAEALDMLQAMNTGHDGSLSTGHSNSTKDMLSRLETMVLSGNNIPLEAIRQQIASAINIIIQLSRLRDKSRRTVEITEVVGYENGEFQLNTLYKFVEHGEDKNGRIIGGLERTENPMVNTFKFKMAGISDKV
ncbi:CpaF family protein [Clostridium sp. AF32-7AC]|uniref:CpaF family protein n=1 Tax=Clostridium sp. AF32-7AC TaxID=2293010 RepID=UPI000E505794|nr:CpaF family protein [Clostridium sp. AF32-7AC]RHP42243.1 CpaF family protein [Clostridium sp. AF32-7AC]